MLNIGFIHSGKEYYNDEFFNPKNNNYNRDDSQDQHLKLFKFLNSLDDICFHTIDYFKNDMVDVVIVYNHIASNMNLLFKLIKKNPSLKIIYIMYEPSTVVPIHESEYIKYFPIDMIFTWNTDVINELSNAKKLNVVNSPIEEIPSIDFHQKDFLTSIFSYKHSNSSNELYTEREKAIKFFALKKDVVSTLYGMGWERCKDVYIQSIYRGSIDNKIEVLKNYKFSICYENTRESNGYISEKIFDCFRAGVVPIYYGTDNISDTIPKQCFIDFSDFGNYEDLYKFLISIDENKYNQYLLKAKFFLNSDIYKTFTSEYYVKVIYEALESLKKSSFKHNIFKIRIKLFIMIIKNIKVVIKNHKRLILDIFKI